MRHLCFLLALASLAVALPLKKGNTWTWQVTDWHLHYRTWRTAVLLDSARVDSGTEWNLLVRDSVTGKRDTATLLSRPDGSQCWIVTSAWAPWDPAPPSARDLAQMGGHSYPLALNSQLAWGGSYLIANFPISYQTPNLDNDTSGGWRFTADFMGFGISFQSASRHGLPAFFDYTGPEWSGTAGFPAEQWSDSLGFEKGELLPSFDWLLIARNGRSVVLPRESLQLPSVGDSLVWSETSIVTQSRMPTDTTSLIRKWKIFAIQPDSANWTNIWIRQTTSGPGLGESGDQIEVHINPAFRDLVQLPIQAQGWVRILSDLSDSSGRIRESRWNYSNIGGGPVGSANSSKARFDLLGNLADFSCKSTQFNDMGMPGTLHDSSVAIHLIYAGRAAGIHGETARNSDNFSLTALAALHPSLSIRWRDVRGRTGRIPASSLLRGQGGSGLLFLDATLPDGSRWSGSWMATRR